MNSEAIALLEEFVTEYEPRYMTPAESIWNRARRLITKHNTGEIISRARSFDYETGEWVL